MYALTDALAHNHLLVGTVAAYRPRQDLAADVLRRYQQSPDPDRYITVRPSSTSTGSPAPCPKRRPSRSGPASAGTSPATAADDPHHLARPNTPAHALPRCGVLWVGHELDAPLQKASSHARAR